MPATEKELKFDFSDSSKTDSQKWKLFVKDLLYLVMNTHGPLGSLADVRTITLNEDSPGDNLWGFTDLQPFTEQFNSPNEKTFLALKDKWFKIQMLVYSNLDSSFLTSDTELVNKYWLSVMSGLASNPANREIVSSSGASEHQDIFFLDFFSIFF